MTTAGEPFDVLNGPDLPLQVGDRVLGTLLGREMLFEVTEIKFNEDGSEETTLVPVQESD